MRKAFLFILVGVLLAHSVYFYPNLPEILATSFDGAGMPNGWQSKTVFFGLEAGFFSLMLGIFASVPFIMTRAPRSLVTLPHQDIWMAPDRRAETFLTITTYFDWFSVSLVGLFVAMNHLVFQTNISKQVFPTRIFLVILLVFLVLLIFSTVKLIRHFSSKPL